MKKFTRDSYCDVRGWDAGLIKKAARMMSEDLDIPVWSDPVALEVEDESYVLRAGADDVGVYDLTSQDNVVNKQVSKEEVEQMIKEREQVKVIDKLSLAADRLIQADKEYQEAVVQAQQEYAGKFEIKPLLKLVAADENSIPEGVDVDDPLTWRKKDIITCIDDGDSPYLTTNDLYQFRGLDRDGDVEVEADDEGDNYSWSDTRFRFVRRP